MDLQEVLKISIVLEVSYEIWDLVSYYLGEILAIDANIQSSEILAVVVLGYYVSFFFYSGGIGGEKVETEKRVVYLV